MTATHGPANYSEPDPRSVCAEEIVAAEGVDDSYYGYWHIIVGPDVHGYPGDAQYRAETSNPPKKTPNGRGTSAVLVESDAFADVRETVDFEAHDEGTHVATIHADLLTDSWHVQYEDVVDEHPYRGYYVATVGETALSGDRTVKWDGFASDPPTASGLDTHGSGFVKAGAFDDVRDAVDLEAHDLGTHIATIHMDLDEWSYSIDYEDVVDVEHDDLRDRGLVARLQRWLL